MLRLQFRTVRGFFVLNRRFAVFKALISCLLRVIRLGNVILSFRNVYKKRCSLQVDKMFTGQVNFYFDVGI